MLCVCPPMGVMGVVRVALVQCGPVVGDAPSVYEEDAVEEIF